MKSEPTLWSTSTLNNDNQSHFEAGQTWSYQTRSKEQASTLTILQVDHDPQLGLIINIRIDGVKIKSREAPDGYSHSIAHVPIKDAALRLSTIKQLSANTTPPADSMRGLTQFRRAFEAGEAGFFFNSGGVDCAAR